ncbi:2-methoxy-6-polyprenyl-1,4-benzoquinol methylase, mitochondrial [subsurface metagenome]
MAELDLTKHLGGLKATNELIELCHIDKGKYVLDVGCGVGMTPCYIAKRYGCRVVGIDISNRMIERANERARRRGVEDRVKFKIADVQNLPFKDALFDVVIGESFLPMVEDKQKAVEECVRVAKPGGYVGFNETTWMKAPTPELLAYLSRTYGSDPEILTPDGWKQLLGDSGLKDVVARTHEITVSSEFVERIRRYGLKHFLGIWYRFFSLYIVKPTYRTFLKEALSQPKQLSEHWRYGIYVGRR